ncbi:MAG: FAD-dependent oxidoreductase, partial [Clostridiales bacterium]|nr:FAD-dependent oxidoreductase [Clostridiales bacterium]
MKVVIIGGVAGGATAAARLRRLNEEAQIIILERGGYISYANCGLPYYIGGEITEKNALTLQTPQSFFARFRIDVRVKNEAVQILPDEKKVIVRRLDDGSEYEETYDKLILSPGAKPVKPPLPGIDGKRIFTLRSVEDTFLLDEFIKREQPKRAVVIGGGFIGLEMAENLKNLGLEVTVVERLNVVMTRLDYDMACSVHGYLQKKGIRLLRSKAVTGFEEQEHGISTLLENGEAVEADLVVLAIGVAPETALAEKSGLELGARGSIVVNDRMETSVPDIYAVGDAVELVHYVSGRKTLIPLAGPANKQGRIAADNICGGDSRYLGAQGSSVVKVCELTVAATGLNEKAAQAAGLSYEKIVLSPLSHAGYYPGGKLMTMKVLYEKGSQRLLGAQIVGHEGVDKRIDVLATAMQAGLPVTALKDLDLAYAPPYASAKDPVNLVGFMAENLEQGVVKQFHWEDVAGLPRDGSVTLLDARTPGEYSGGCAEGFVNVP